MRKAVLLLSLAGAMLYLGPFLAGLSAAPLTALPVFVAAFVLWIVMLRPALWRMPAGGAMLPLTLRLSGVTLVQVLLVAVAFAVGRGLAALLGGPLALPLWLPPVLSLAALPLARLVWRPQSPETDAFLDEALASVTRAAAAPEPADEAPETRARLDRDAIALHVNDLAARIAAGPVSDEDLYDILAELSHVQDHDAALAALEARQGDHPAWRTAALRFLGHPCTDRLSTPTARVVDTIAAGFAATEADHRDEALIMAHGWLMKFPFGVDADRLLALAEADLATADTQRADSLHRLIDTLREDDR